MIEGMAKYVSLALCLGCVGNSLAETTTIFEVGKWDKRYEEFARFPAVLTHLRKPFVFEAGKTGAAEVPCIMTGPSDGNPNLANPFTVKFSLDRLPDKPVFTFAAFGSSSRALKMAVQIDINGKTVHTESWRATPHMIEVPKDSHVIELALPDGALRKGDNMLSVRVTDGDFITLDAMALTDGEIENKPEYAIPWWVRDAARRGMYFSKKTYVSEALPEFEASKPHIPHPILEDHPDYIRCYWKAWELAFTHFRQPDRRSLFVSNYIDEAFNEGLFLWDTAFMTMFVKYIHHIFPGIDSLDNFYASQFPDGEIVREIDERTGDARTMFAEPGTPASLNHPILSWAEWESYMVTGDKERLAMVYEPLKRYYRSYEKIKDEKTGFCRGTWASMDNSPRTVDHFCSIDTTAEVISSARDLARIASVLGKKKEAIQLNMEADALSERVNALLWNDEVGFYFDWLLNAEQQQNVKTVAAFWTLLGNIASEDQARRLVDHINDPNEFNREHRVPTLPADEKGYKSTGDYWRGSVWAPIEMMVVRGLERYGYADLAREIARNHLLNVVKVFEETDTIWENYAPDSAAPGQPAKKDFVGWSGLGPIVFLIEHMIGIKPDAPSNTIVWRIDTTERCGVENLWFAGKTVTLICEKRESPRSPCHVTARGDGKFKLIIKVGEKRKRFRIRAGKEKKLVFKPKRST